MELSHMPGTQGLKPHWRQSWSGFAFEGSSGRIPQVGWLDLWSANCGDMAGGCCCRASSCCCSRAGCGGSCTCRSLWGIELSSSSLSCRASLMYSFCFGGEVCKELDLARWGVWVWKGKDVSSKMTSVDMMNLWVCGSHNYTLLWILHIPQTQAIQTLDQILFMLSWCGSKLGIQRCGGMTDQEIGRRDVHVGRDNQ